VAVPRIDFRFDSPMHLLVIYDEGARREGETSIDGLTQSRLHNLVNKLTFVPAGHIYHEWHETSRPTRITFLYLKPAKLQRSVGMHPEYVPRTFFEDSDLRGTAVKLKSVIESGQGKSSLYSDALVNLLAHELSRSGQDFARTPPVYRGGLISWQMRAVIAYIEEHLDERMDLVTLARLVRLSRYHFSRAFKRSLGVSPRQYHNQRRIERAKVLLGDRTTSITDVAPLLAPQQLGRTRGTKRQGAQKDRRRKWCFSVSHDGSLVTHICSARGFSSLLRPPFCPAQRCGAASVRRRQILVRCATKPR
jgi:AraC family transcriptional regulator